VLLYIVSIVDDGVHTGDLLLGHLSVLLDIVSIVDDGVHTGDILLGHLSVLLDIVSRSPVCTPSSTILTISNNIDR
jgi:predicted phosphoribosyltransferase